MTDGRLRVVYLAGAQHCGSTFLDAILGAAPGARSLGEVAGFQRYESAPSCDCRLPPASCAPCQAVVASLESSGSVDELRRLGPVPLKERRIWWMLSGLGGRREYARLADEMLAAAAASTDSSVVIDSSKNISRAAALVHESEHDVRIVHLVRDGRSYLRSKQKRAANDGRRVIAPVALAVWLGKNLLLWSVLRRRVGADRYLLCRYEDLMADPAAELDRLGRFADLDTVGLAETATTVGVERRHLFEPTRQLDYHHVTIEPGRSATARLSPAREWAFWLGGGFLSSRWRYTRRQVR